MVELNSNPEALLQHENDPEQAARDFGLNEEDIQLIINLDIAEIERRCDSSTSETKGLMILNFKS